MSVKIESLRFGAFEVDENQVLEFPRGLIGIPGTGYVLVDLSPGAAFRWLHSTENPAFALPVVDPSAVVPEFVLTVDKAERERHGIEDIANCEIYVTVKADPDPAATTLNLRAPIVIMERRGYQLLNSAPGADLRAPLPLKQLERAPESVAR